MSGYCFRCFITGSEVESSLFICFCLSRGEVDIHLLQRIAEGFGAAASVSFQIRFTIKLSNDRKVMFAERHKSVLSWTKLPRSHLDGSKFR